jgi:hypothetical protein
MLGSFYETLENNYKKLLAFSSNYPDLRDLLDAFIVSSRAMISDSLEHAKRSLPLATAHLCWRNVYSYQEDSLVLLILGKPDEGYGLLRMAAELSRDTARICENVSYYEMWQDRQKTRFEKRYKDVFRFREDDHIEKLVFSLYNMFSDFGIHGHQTVDIFRSKHDFSPDGDYMIMRATDFDILDSLVIWLASFFPLQTLASRGFQGFLSEKKSVALKSFLEMTVASGDVIKELRDKVEEMKRQASKLDVTN